MTGSSWKMATSLAGQHGFDRAGLVVDEALKMCLKRAFFSSAGR